MIDDADGAERGRQLIDGLRRPLPAHVYTRLTGALDEAARLRNARRATLRLVAVAAAVTVLVTLASIGIGRQSPTTAANPLAVVSALIVPNNSSTARPSASIRTLTVDGQTVVIAVASSPIAMPMGAAAIDETTDSWLVEESRIHVVCFNGPRPVVIASLLDADRLVKLAAEEHLI